MAHRFSSSTSQPNANFGTPVSNNSQFNRPPSILSYHVKETHVSIIDPIHDNIPTNEQRKEIRSVLKTPIIYNDDFIPIDDFSNGFTYESHLGRFCNNVIVVSARHPHSFFLQTIEDLTYSDNFFSKMNEFYNRCFDAQRLVISKAALRINLCCVTRDETETDVWNRAQLLEYHPETDQCSLLLVDLGTWQECVPRSNLRHILVPFRQECVRSVPCRLAGIAPAKPEKNGLWNECNITDAIKTFRNVIDNVPTEVEVLDRSSNGSYFVNLFVTTHDTFVCVNDFLLYHKIAIPIDDCKILKPEELDPITHEPLLAIIYEFNLQGDTLFDPSLSENTIERFALLYKFSPVIITPLTNAVLCANLEKYMTLMNDHRKKNFHGHEIKIALYSIDCVRKLLLNHHCNNEFIFERLDEAREAEMKDDQDFWEIPQQNHSLIEKKKFIEESKQSQIALLKSHKNQLEHHLEQISSSNSNYKSIQRQLIDTMEKLSVFSSDSNSSF
ncbi:unnamed protein product [Rotaria sp. Silwood1]|nr:unnamed protein product [Rotaria sp. Silwood1]